MYMPMSDRGPYTPFKLGPKYEQLGLVKYLLSFCEQDSLHVPISTKPGLPPVLTLPISRACEYLKLLPIHT